MQNLATNPLSSGHIAYHPELKYCYVLLNKGSKALVCYQDHASQHFSFKAIGIAELKAVA